MPNIDEAFDAITSGSEVKNAQPQGSPDIDAAFDAVAGDIQTGGEAPVAVASAPKQSPISITERIGFSFADDRGRESALRKKFNFVEKLPNGKFAAGNSMKDMQPIDPEGVFNDVIGDLADIVGEIPVIAGQIVGTTAGAVAGAVPGAVAGAAAGSLAGEGVKKAVGKIIGVNEQNAQEVATDMAISAAFGAAGEGLAQGASVIGKKVIAPQIVKALSKGMEEAKNAGKESAAANVTAKLFRFLSSVPEESTLAFSKYGFKEMENPKHFDKTEILSIVDDAVKNLDEASKTIMTQVQKNKGDVIKVSKRIGEQSHIPIDDLFSVLKTEAQRLDILDSFGKVNKKYPNSEEVKPLTSLLQELGTVDDTGRYVAKKGKKLSVEKAIKISESYGQKFEKVTPRVQRVFVNILNGSEDGSLVGIRQRVGNFAQKAGLEDYARSNELASSFMRLREGLSSLDTKNPGKIESFISRLEGIGQIPKRDLYELEKYTKSPFIKRWELWNAGQDFTKANPSILKFVSIGASLGLLTGWGETPGSKAAMYGGAVLLGTPAGLRAMTRAAYKARGAVGKDAVSKVVGTAMRSKENKAATAVLSELLKQKSRTDTEKNKGK